DIRIEAGQSGNADYAEASPAAQRMHIGRAPLSVGVAAAARAYGEGNPAFELTYSGFVNGEDASALTAVPAAVTQATETSAPGIYGVTVGGGQSSNYTFSYSAGTLEISKATQ